VYEYVFFCERNIRITLHMSEKNFSQPFYGSKYRGIVISFCLTTLAGRREYGIHIRMPRRTSIWSRPHLSVTNSMEQSSWKANSFFSQDICILWNPHLHYHIQNGNASDLCLGGAWFDSLQGYYYAEKVFVLFLRPSRRMPGSDLFHIQLIIHLSPYNLILCSLSYWQHC